MNTLEQLDKLGFKSACKVIKDKVEQSKKMHIAYQNFDFITMENVQEFNKYLREKTHQNNQQYVTYDQLQFITIENYTEAPPQEVLEKLEQAKELNCFDIFEIGKIQAVQERKDPILFGKINGCGDYFCIAQWDNDVSMEIIREAIKEKEAQK